MDNPPSPAMNRLLVHYGEIGVKSGNRRMFEDILGRNLGGALTGLGVGPFNRESGRLVATISSEADPAAVAARAAQVPGVAWCAPARSVKSDLDTMTETVLGMAVPHPKVSFRIDTKRTDKTFPHDSPAVNRTIGAAVVEATGRPVSLDSAEYRYGVEIDRHRTYVYWDRREGVGGLPVGCEGSLVSLLSGGLDSPVAAFRMMVRGCRIHLLHFLNRSVSTNRVVEKIEALARRLAVFHGPISLTIVPFDEAQREIVMVVPAELRMIVYRRMMLRIAEVIRAEKGALGFVTGDSVGQVASQTLENLVAIYEAAHWPVYAPLSGTSKVEITEQARKIGTYEISILPHEDCCSFLVARHPVTKADLETVKLCERFDAAALVAKVLAGREEKWFDPRPAPELPGSPPG